MTDSNEQSAWGSADTQFFYALTPERILAALEACGLPCTGRCMALNSMENRVYEVELEVADPQQLKSPSEAFRIAKFYRPGRWSKEQILEEHEFLLDLKRAEIPVIAPLEIEGNTVFRMQESELYYAIFPKQGGRNPDELNSEQLHWLGRLMARMHNVGQSKEARARVLLTPESYGRQNLTWLLEHNAISPDCTNAYRDVVLKICELAEPLFNGVSRQRIHGDAHAGNLLWGGEGPFWLDFDDMLRGPCVQDLWLLLPGRDAYAREQLHTLLDGYQQMRRFDRRELALIEPLRALRLIHFSGWIAKRWEDPAFQRAFPAFNGPHYWQHQVQDLRDQLQYMQPGTSIWDS